jgi:hypothetical protein
MSEPMQPIVSKPITQAQLELCRAALNIASLQCEVTCHLTNGKGETRTAEHFNQAAKAMRELANLIDAGHIVGSNIIRATELQ